MPKRITIESDGTWEGTNIMLNGKKVSSSKGKEIEGFSMFGDAKVYDGEGRPEKSYFSFSLRTKESKSDDESAVNYLRITNAREEGEDPTVEDETTEDKSEETTDDKTSETQEVTKKEEKKEEDSETTEDEDKSDSDHSDVEDGNKEENKPKLSKLEERLKATNDALGW